MLKVLALQLLKVSAASIAVYVFVTMALISGINIFVPFACSFGGAPVPDAERQYVSLGNGTLKLYGNINASLLRLVEIHLAKAEDQKITEVELVSRGGEEGAAFAIAETLERLGHRVTRVPPGGYCDSACVLLLLGHTNVWEVADNATLLFHTKWTRFGNGTEPCCDRAETAYNALIRLPFFHWLYGVSVMRDWANALAPGLGDGLSTCSPDPFSTRAGVRLSGRHIAAFRQNRGNAAICGAEGEAQAG